MAEHETCPECGGTMEHRGIERRMFEPDPDMTDGQRADLHAASMGGFFEEGVHGATFKKYECNECGHRVMIS